MTRPYSPSSPYDSTQTERYADQRTDVAGTYGGSGDYPDSSDYEDYEDYEDYDAYAEFDDYDEPIDRRWIWIAGVAGAILLVAVICSIVILGGGDSGSVSATVSAPATTSQAAITTAAPPAATSKPPVTSSLPPETVTTVIPSETATAAPTAPPAAAAPVPNTVTYRVTGTRNLIDLVTVIYTDQQGALQTEVNVALPWTKTVVLDPGVELRSVTATSVAGQLNCSISDGAGATIVEQSSNSIIATCTK